MSYAYGKFNTGLDTALTLVGCRGRRCAALLNLDYEGYPPELYEMIH